MFSDNTSTSINLSYNEIDDRGAIVVAEWLKTNYTPKSLILVITISAMMAQTTGQQVGFF